MILGFDIDGTLVEQWTTTPLPQVTERIATLHPSMRLFLATNQSGPTWRRVTGKTHYPEPAKVAQVIVASYGLFAAQGLAPLVLVATWGPEHSNAASAPRWVAASTAAAASLAEAIQARAEATLGVQLPLLMCPDHGDRKPHPGMLVRARAHFPPLADGLPQPERCLYVGDRAIDRQAAAEAGYFFVPAAAWRTYGLPPD